MPSVSIYLPEEELAALDGFAGSVGLSRSGAIARLLVEHDDAESHREALESRVARLEELAGL